MTNAYRIALFEGDGIGPEITAPACRLLERAAERAGAPPLEWQDCPAGAAHYQKTGEALPKRFTVRHDLLVALIALRNHPAIVRKFAVDEL